MSGRQQRDVKSALAGLWYRPGSTRVGHGWATWKAINDGEAYRISKLHDNPWCHAFPDGAEVHSTDVFNHPELGDYVINPRNGSRIKSPEICGSCVDRGTCTKCGKPETRYQGERTGLCSNHHKAVIRPSRAKPAAVAAVCGWCGAALAPHGRKRGRPSTFCSAPCADANKRHSGTARKRASRARSGSSSHSTKQATIGG